MTAPTLDFNTVPPEVLARLNLLDQADQARGDDIDALALFGQVVFNVSMPAHVKAWAEEILGNLRVGIVAPPESAKTTWMVIIVCWWIGRHPHLTNLIISEAATGALKIALKVVQTIEANPRWKLVFPNVIPDPAVGWSREGWSVIDTKDANWQLKIAKRKDPTIAYGGVGSSDVNGRRVTGILLCDDIHGFASRTSDATCAETVAFVQSLVLARATAEAHVVFVQTRWNPRDVIAYFKTLPHFKVFEHKAIETDADGQEVSYWPSQWPLERLEAKRTETGSIMFELVYQGNDQAAAGTVLKGDWLLPYTVTTTGHFTYFIGIDFALKTESVVGTKDRDRDRFALAVLAHTGDMLVLVDGFADRVGQGEAEERILQYNSVYKPKRIVMETNAGGEQFFFAVLRRAQELGVRLPLQGEKAVKNKGERIMEMQPDFEFGRVRVSDAMKDFLALFREEWLGFGNKRIHDDTLDAVFYAWRAAGYLLPTTTVTERRERSRTVNPWNSLGAQRA